MAKALSRICFFMMVEIVACRRTLASQIPRRRAHFRAVPFAATPPAPERRQTSAISRHDLPELCKNHPPKENRGRRESRVLAAPAASRAKLNKAHERSHHRFRRIQPGLPRAMVLTAYFVLSPATRLYCHRRLRIWYVKTRLGLRTSARLDASIGASEPHDFAVREPVYAKGFDGQKRLSSACHSSAHGPCRPALPSPDIA